MWIAILYHLTTPECWNYWINWRVTRNKGITSFSWTSIFIETLPTVIMLRSKFQYIILYINNIWMFLPICMTFTTFMNLFLLWWLDSFNIQIYFKMKLCPCCMEPLNWWDNIIGINIFKIKIVQYWMIVLIFIS